MRKACIGGRGRGIRTAMLAGNVTIRAASVPLVSHGLGGLLNGSSAHADFL